MTQSHIQLNAPAPRGKRPRKQRSEKSGVKSGVLFIFVVAVGFAIWLFASGTAGEFFDALKGANLPWILLGALFFCAFFSLDMVCYRVAALGTTFCVGFIGL